MERLTRRTLTCDSNEQGRHDASRWYRYDPSYQTRDDSIYVNQSLSYTASDSL